MSYTLYGKSYLAQVSEVQLSISTKHSWCNCGVQCSDLEGKSQNRCSGWGQGLELTMTVQPKFSPFLSSYWKRENNRKGMVWGARVGEGRIRMLPMCLGRKKYEYLYSSANSKFSDSALASIWKVWFNVTVGKWGIESLVNETMNFNFFDWYEK